MNIPRLNLATTALVVLSLCACASVRSEMLTDQVFSPRPDEYSIAYYGADAELERPYIKIAIVHGEAEDSSWSIVLKAMKNKARQLGADALILIDQHTEVEGTDVNIYGQEEHAHNLGDGWQLSVSGGIFGESTSTHSMTTSVRRSTHMSAYAIRWK